MNAVTINEIAPRGQLDEDSLSFLVENKAGTVDCREYSATKLLAQNLLANLHKSKLLL